MRLALAPAQAYASYVSQGGVQVPTGGDAAALLQDPGWILD